MRYIFFDSVNLIKKYLPKSFISNPGDEDQPSNLKSHIFTLDLVPFYQLLDYNKLIMLFIFSSSDVLG
jgi:hypothetical protein